MALDLLVEAKSDAALVQRYFGTVALEAGPYMTESITAGGELILGEVQQEISTEGGGAPSPAGGPPYQQTGEYLASWELRPAGSIASQGFEIWVGTDAPQGARLEYGFEGTDSLGRHVSQAPRPHLGPACDKVFPLIADDLLDKILDSSAVGFTASSWTFS